MSCGPKPGARLRWGEAVLDQRYGHPGRLLLDALDGTGRWPLGACAGRMANLLADPTFSKLLGHLRVRALDGRMRLAAVWTVAGPRFAGRWKASPAGSRLRLPISRSSIARLQRKDLLVDLVLVAAAIVEDAEDGVPVALLLRRVVHGVHRSRAAAVHEYCRRLGHDGVPKSVE